MAVLICPPSASISAEPAHRTGAGQRGEKPDGYILRHRRVGCLVIELAATRLEGPVPVNAAFRHRIDILEKAWPIILANASIPLLGLVDTAVIGHTGTTFELGALALGNLVFSFLYWAFGFLRMSTTGFVAQAAGDDAQLEVRASLARALLLAVTIGLLLITSHTLIEAGAFALLKGSAEVEGTARTYFAIRIWGAPATLGLFVINGILIGLGKSRYLLALQITLNSVNIALDVIFAGVFGWGVEGIAAGTLIAEWTVFLLSTSCVIYALRKNQPTGEPLWPFNRIFDSQLLRRTLAVNRDIMVRTVLLLLVFAWFTNQSALYGDTVLAANYILLQVVAFSAFFLDGFAFVAEAEVGYAIGKKNRKHLLNAIYFSSELAAIAALVLAGSVIAFGPYIVYGITSLPEVRTTAVQLLPWAAVYIAISVAAFQLDGIFIGATCARQMRDASLLSFLVFVSAWWPLTELFGVHGLWLSFVLYVCARAVSLWWYFSAVRNKI